MEPVLLKRVSVAVQPSVKEPVTSTCSPHEEEQAVPVAGVVNTGAVRVYPGVPLDARHAVVLSTKFKLTVGHIFVMLRIKYTTTLVSSVTL